ncbi:MAG: hypothetical protein WCI55_04900 [Armatimonadota bacterium]
MHTEFQPEDPEVLKAMKYDRRDIKVPMLKSWTTWITGSCIVCFLVSIPVYNWLSTPGKTLPSMLGTTREMAPKSSNRIPAGYPLLQDNFSTKVDIKQLRMHEDETMSSFGWVDQNNGVVRVPISKAMKMVLQNGVSTGTQVPAMTKGNTIPQNGVGPGTSKPNP